MTLAECIAHQKELPEHSKALLCGHLPLVKIVLAKMRRGLPDHADLEELYSVGLMGLIDAALKFDTARGFAFETFASFRVRGAIQDALRTMDQLTRTGRKKFKSIIAAENELSQHLGRKPTEEEVAQKLAISVNKLSKMRSELEGRFTFSLDHCVGEEDHTFESVIRDEKSISADQSLEDKELKENLLAHLKGMPYRERTVLELYYFEGLKLNQIGEKLGITEARVSQIRATALKTLSEHFQRSDLN
jgi:RNA polymerase sigma factor for flagellar operon FliA